MLWKILLFYLLVINLMTFILYGDDKRRAVKNKWRIPEKTLLGAAFLGGSAGALAGMQVFHHKTKHWKFKIGVPVCLVLHVVLGYLYCTEILWKLSL
ncbi:MAG: DUF1294 domain-containing protein [Brotaphodocola sp.]